MKRETLSTPGECTGHVISKPVASGLILKSNSQITSKLSSYGGLINGNGLTNGNCFRISSKITTKHPVILRYGDSGYQGLRDGNGLTNGNGWSSNSLPLIGLRDGNGLTNGNGLTIGTGMSFGKTTISSNNASHKDYKIKNERAKIIKNRVFSTIFALILILMPLILYYMEFDEDNSGRIMVDSEFSDWSGVPKNIDLISDQEENVNVNIVDCRLSSDGLHYLFYLEVYGTVLNGIAGTVKSEQVLGLDNIHVFLDTDCKPQTGYRVQSLGADYLIMITGLDSKVYSSSLKCFDQTRNTYDWNGWESVNAFIDVGLKDGRLEAKVPINDLETNGGTIASIFHIQDYFGNQDYSDIIINSNSGSLKITQYSVGENILEINSKDNTVTSLKLSSEDEDIIVDSLVLIRKGTAHDTDTGDINLFLNDLKISTGQIVSGQVEFVFDEPILVKKDESIILDVSIDISSTAEASNVIGFELTDIHEMTTDANAPIILESNSDLKYIEEIPDGIVIDGAFDDWDNIPEYLDSDPQVLKNQNIDVNEYRVATSEKDLSLYFKVDGEMLGGTYVPVNPGFILPDSESSESTSKNSQQLQNDEALKTEVENLKQQIPKSEIMGEDSAYIFLDTDLNFNTGYLLKDVKLGADYMLKVSGKAGKILKSECLEYTGGDHSWLIVTTDYDNWLWEKVSEIPAAIDDKRLETQLDFALAGISSIDTESMGIFFYIEDWNSERDSIDDFIHQSLVDMTPDRPLTLHDLLTRTRAPGGPLNELVSGVGSSGDDSFGWYVSAAGDINNDGCSDVIVGAPYNDSQDGSKIDAGAAYIFYGYPSISMNNINASNANVTLYGVNADDNFGWSASDAGDVDGNGYDDVLIGAPGKGEAYIFLSMDNGSGIANGASPNITLIGNSSDKFGFSVSSTGDMNNDNFDDVVIGAPQNSTGTGAVYIFFCNNSMAANIYDSDANLTMAGNSVGGNYFGFSVSSAGNVNGDGFYDVIVGAPMSTIDLDIVSGGDDFKVTFNNNTNGNGSSWSQTNVYTGTNVIESVAIGDIDGDGDLDIVSGDSNFNVIFHKNTNGDASSWSQTTVYTAPNFIFSVTLGDMDGDGDLDIVSGDANKKVIFHNNTNGDGTSWFQTTVYTAAQAVHAVAVGDVDDDGDLDIASGDKNNKVIYHNNTNGDGSSWFQTTVYTATNLINTVDVGDIDGDGDGDIASGDVSNNLIFHNNTNGDGSSWSQITVYATTQQVESVIIGDIDGDGDLDITSGDRNKNVIFHNNSNGDGSSWSQINVYKAGSNVNSVAIGDIDGDSDIDIASGSKDNNIYFHNNTNGDGSSWSNSVVYTTTDIVRSVAIGDLDGDGFQAGKAYIYYGSSTLDNKADVKLKGETAKDNFGWAVSFAGDVNGGNNDVIIGAPGCNNSQGKANLFYGDGSIGPNPDVVFSGGNSGDRFGYSVSEAGNINNDGYDDVIVGAPYNDTADGSKADTGAIYIFYGNITMSDKTASEADNITYGENANDHFGWAVSKAGNVNGSGNINVIVGAPHFDDGMNTDAGKAYVYTTGAIIPEFNSILIPILIMLTIIIIFRKKRIIKSKPKKRKEVMQ
jgi:hypothetical protein